MSETAKLRACWLMAAVGLVLTVDIVRIAHYPADSRARGKGKAARPV